MPGVVRESADVRLGLNVRALRERKGMSQAELVKQMRERGHRWHQQTATRVEAGEQPVRFAELESLAQILGTTLDRLSWNSGEANAAEYLYGRGANIRRSGHAVSDAVLRLLLDLAAGRQAAEQLAADEREHVTEARTDLLGALEEWDLPEAVGHGEDRYEELREEGQDESAAG